MDAPRHIAILRLSALGDVCHALPALRAAQATWPEARFTWIVAPVEQALLAGMADVETVVYSKRSGLAGMRRLHAELVRRYGGHPFDLLLHLQTSARSNLLSALALSARLKVGLGPPLTREGHGWVNHRLVPPPPRAHAVDAYLAVVEALGAAKAPPRWDLPLSATARAWAAERLPEGPWLALNPTASPSRRVWREWPLERLARVAEAAWELGLKPCLVGGPGERERRRAATLRAACRVPLVDLTGATDIPRLLAVLARARLLLSVDSGPVHLATAVGTPVIGLYGATDPHQTGPYRDRHRVVSVYAEAVAAEYGRPPEALPWGTRCHRADVMERIEVAQVTARLEAVWRELQWRG